MIRTIPKEKCIHIGPFNGHQELGKKGGGFECGFYDPATIWTEFGDDETCATCVRFTIKGEDLLKLEKVLEFVLERERRK